MDLVTFERLRTPYGEQALAAATEWNPTDATLLTCVNRLRKWFPADLAQAAIETILLRRKAAIKFTHADRMFFTREGLEVSSSETMSRYRAERFRRFSTVGDLGCGIGGDAIGLAASGRHMIGVDRDELRVRMAEANLAAYSLSKQAQFHVADLLSDPWPDVPAAFADPGRRAEGRRFLSLRDYLPPPDELVRRLPARFPIAFKLAPGVAWSDLEPFDGECEFVSVEGELKECVLWCGELSTVRRRATVLIDQQTHTLAADTPLPQSGPVPVAAYLYDPDAAVVRAGLVRNLAHQLGAESTDARVQLLTSDTHTLTPFATVYRVDVVLPFDSRHVVAALRERKVGRVTLVNRGSIAEMPTPAKWKLNGENHRFVMMTRVLGKQVAVIGDRV
jgi:hypothetical protein